MKTIYLLMILLSNNAYSQQLLEIFGTTPPEKNRSLINYFNQRGFDVEYYSVNAINALSKSLTEQYLKGVKDEKTALKITSKMMNSPNWRDVVAKTKRSAIGIEKAYSYQLSKIPAYVFNGKDVVYGGNPSVIYRQYMNYSGGSEVLNEN